MRYAGKIDSDLADSTRIRHNSVPGRSRPADHRRSLLSMILGSPWTVTVGTRISNPVVPSRTGSFRPPAQRDDVAHDPGIGRIRGLPAEAESHGDRRVRGEARGRHSGMVENNGQSFRSIG